MLLLEQFEHLTLHPKNAAKLKELVLQLAVQGKLTENWRRQNPAVEPAAALLKRIEAEKAQLVKEKKIKKENPLEPISANEVPYTLPESWTWCRLNDIAEYIQRGKSPSYVDESDVPVVSQKCIQWDGFYLDRAKFIDPSTLSKYGEERLLIVNDILWNSTGDGTVGRATLYPDTTDYKKVVADSHVTIVRLMEKAKLPYFIKYFIASPTVQENLKVSGSTKQTELNTSTVKSQLVPLPPLAEQEAIVARVEELMQKIEELEKQTAARIQLKKNLSTAALQQLTAAADEQLEQNWLFLKQHFQSMFDETENVKRLRETILQLAVQGKLTATWRKYNPTTEPASELLKRIQAEKAQLVKDKKIKKEKPLEPISADEVPYTLPEDWVWCRLGELATSFNNGLYKPSKFYTDPGIISLRMYNIQEGSISFHDLRRVELLPEELDTYILEENDILLNRVNSAELIGKAALIPKYEEGLVYESMNIRIRLIFKNHVAKYSNLLLRTSFARDYMRANAKHAIGQSSVNQTTVSNLLYPLPPIAEQEAIVAKVDQLMKLCDALEQQIQQSKKETEALMQAVVQEALQVQEEVV